MLGWLAKLLVNLPKDGDVYPIRYGIGINRLQWYRNGSIRTKEKT
jgi:hypothetical protein